MPRIGNCSKGGSNPGSLDCESGIIKSPLSYLAALRRFISVTAETALNVFIHVAYT